MSGISTNAVHRIKEAAPLPLIAGEYLKLRKSGHQHLAQCLWHQDKDPSLRVYADHYYCFVCQSHGDVVDLVARAEGISKGSAMRLLSERTGIPLDPQAPPRTRLQRAYDADEMAFAEWWVARQVDQRGELISMVLDCEEIDAAWLVGMSGTLIALRNAPRSKWRELALRCASQEDRAEWAWLQSWLQSCLRAMAAPVPADSIRRQEVALPGNLPCGVPA